MPDPIDDLRRLHQDGVTVHPLPPSEVRRRGDRLRRRPAGLTALAAAAAVAIIATSGVVLAGGTDRSAPDPAPPAPTQSRTQETDGEPTPAPDPPPARTTTIPDNFPIDLNLESPEGDPVSGPAPDAEGINPIEVCGQEGFFEGWVERIATRATGPEFLDGRELLTFPDEVAAGSEVTAFRDAVVGCSPQRDPAAGPEEPTRVWTLHDLEAGEDSFAASLTLEEFLGSSVLHVVRVGNAVLVAQTDGEGELTSTVPLILAEREPLIREIAREMCVFVEGDCGPVGETKMLGPHGIGKLQLGMTAAEIDATGEAASVRGYRSSLLVRGS